MAEVNPAAFLQNRTDHSALVTRTLADALTNGSAVVGVSDLKVTQRAAGANMSVDVAGGICFVEGTESATQGAYCCRSDATPTNVVISASSPTLPRIDIIVARVQDAFYSGVTNAWSIVAVTGTAASSPVAPAAPNNALILAQVAVAANATSVINSNITDKRVVASGRLYTGDFVCTSTTRPAVPWTGLVIFETDTKNRYVYDGSTWQLLESAGKSPYAVATGIVNITTVAGTVAGPQAVTWPSSRFSVAPIVTCLAAATAGNLGGASARADSITSTGANFYLVGTNAMGAGAVIPVNWIAVQMTPTTAAG